MTQLKVIGLSAGVATTPDVWCTLDIISPGLRDVWIWLRVNSFKLTIGTFNSSHGQLCVHGSRCTICARLIC
jgi:hypothetical protein